MFVYIIYIIFKVPELNVVLARHGAFLFLLILPASPSVNQPQTKKMENIFVLYKKANKWIMYNT